jgi:hypothetical protein
MPFQLSDPTRYFELSQTTMLPSKRIIASYVLDWVVIV